MIVGVIGVSGSGRSTIGVMLARAMRCQFLEGDALHSQQNIDKMRAGRPLEVASKSTRRTMADATRQGDTRHGSRRGRSS